MLKPFSNPEREAVVCMLNQLRLAFQLLDLSVSQGDLVWKAGIVDIARDVVVHVTEALSRMPSLSTHNRVAIEDRLADLGTALAGAVLWFSSRGANAAEA